MRPVHVDSTPCPRRLDALSTSTRRKNPPRVALATMIFRPTKLSIQLSNNSRLFFYLTGQFCQLSNVLMCLYYLIMFISSNNIYLQHSPDCCKSLPCQMQRKKVTADAPTVYEHDELDRRPELAHVRTRTHGFGVFQSG